MFTFSIVCIREYNESIHFNVFILFSVIMPPSALAQLTGLNINYPMLFKLTNKNTERITHCGVLEFVADEGKVYLPLWVRYKK